MIAIALNQKNKKKTKKEKKRKNKKIRKDTKDQEEKKSVHNIKVFKSSILFISVVFCLKLHPFSLLFFFSSLFIISSISSACSLTVV